MIEDMRIRIETNPQESSKVEEQKKVLTIMVSIYAPRDIHAELGSGCDTAELNTRENYYHYNEGNPFILRHLELASMLQKQYLKGNI